MASVRVRIAPSPSGNLHVGTARTALFNVLFARNQGGTFILRVEDTDQGRSEEAYLQNIYESLTLLGLPWDEGPGVGGPYGPYKQSERLDIYPAFAQKLLDNGTAYYCYCTPEELDAEKQQAMLEKKPYVYSRRCCNAQVAEALKQDPNRQAALRFKIPDAPETIVLNDLVRGDVRFETALIGDFVIMKSNGIPSYNFAVVVDDITMKISHVIRGEDHVPNTPKQMLLYQALGESMPAFAHVGMILAPDRSKLSKRHGATAVSEFIKQGYLPEAFTNFLALLGWSPPDGQEIGTLDHFAQQFSLERIVSSPAVFDKDKLNWLNGSTIRALGLPDLLARCKPFLADYDLTTYPEEKLLIMLDAVREPLVTLSEVTDAVGYFFGDLAAPTDETVIEVLNSLETQTVLDAFQSRFLPQADFTSAETLGAQVKTFANDLKPLKMKTVMWSIRAALTGRVHGADLSKTLYILGADLVAHRIRLAMQVARV